MKKLIAMLVACLATGTVCAQEQVVIHYSDVNLTTAAGASVLYRRIANASQEVCHQESVLALNGYLMWRKCVRDAIGRAVASVDNPLVTARYHGETPPRLYSSRATTK